MGDRLTGWEPRKTSDTPCGDIFDEQLPYYLAMGMPYDLFWDGEVGTRRAFRKAYLIRIENEQRMADVNNWYMGQYIIGALQAVPLFVGGLNTKGITLPEYPDKPFLQKAEGKKKEEDRQKQEEDQSKLAQAMFQQMVANMNGNIIRRLEREKREREGSGQ